MPRDHALADRAARLVESDRFQNVIGALIVANAVVLGLETYDDVDERFGAALDALDQALLVAFTVELGLRMIAARLSWRRFSASGWNVFDLVVVGASWMPFLQANASLLRLLRLLRITRLLRLLPDVRVLIDGATRALRPAAGLAVIALLLVYVYAMLGWQLFGEELPERWGNVGKAMMSLFSILTLEGWIDMYDAARAVTPLAVVYFLSFILAGTFVVLNMVIGVVLTSLDDAHKAARERDVATAAGNEIGSDVELERRIGELRSALEAVEASLAERRAAT